MNNGAKIYVVGIGPGDRKHMTLRALEALAESDVIVGYTLYIKLLGDLTAGKEVYSSGMRGEVERCRKAVQEALRGKKVSLVSSGDAGIYGMAGILLQVLEEQVDGGGELPGNLPGDIPVEVVPGVTAASAAAAALGAPLMHDFAVISLSDLLTPWELIRSRLHRAGEGDFVVALYNPRSRGRKEQVREARDILLLYRSAQTPVGIVRSAGRGGETRVLTNLGEMLEHEIDMSATVIIGSSKSYIRGDTIITPRGYAL